MFGQHVVHIEREWHTDHFRLDFLDRFHTDRARVLCDDGTWTDVADGATLPTNHGILIPGYFRKPFHKAVIEWAGDLNAEATEVKVLREWLSSERNRVDHVWNQRG